MLEAPARPGLLIGKGGLYGNCLRIAPPLTLTADEADEGAAVLVDVLADARPTTRPSRPTDGTLAA